MITVHVFFKSHFKELAGTPEESFELEHGNMCELATKICSRYGKKMQAMLMDPENRVLNDRGTMFVNSRGLRISIEDELEDGEQITFLVGIAGG